MTGALDENCDSCENPRFLSLMTVLVPAHSRSSGRGERGCAFRSAASAAESAKCRMLQPAAQRAESRQPQPAAQPQPASAQNATRESPSVCGAPFSTTSRSGLAAPRSRFLPRTAHSARHAAHGTLLSPVPSITGFRYHGGTGGRWHADGALPMRRTVRQVFCCPGYAD